MTEVDWLWLGVSVLVAGGVAFVLFALWLEEFTRSMEPTWFRVARRVQHHG